MIIVGNKKDLEKERKVAVETAEAVANQYNCPFLEASAKTAEVHIIINYDLISISNCNSFQIECYRIYRITFIGNCKSRCYL